MPHQRSRGGVGMRGGYCTLCVAAYLWHIHVLLGVLFIHLALLWVLTVVLGV